MSLTKSQMLQVWIYLEDYHDYFEDFQETKYSQSPEKDIEEFIIHTRSFTDSLQEVLDDKST